jgi:hypothetical protein
VSFDVLIYVDVAIVDDVALDMRAWISRLLTSTPYSILGPAQIRISSRFFSWHIQMSAFLHCSFWLGF